MTKVIIIGAGLNGIMSTKTWLDIDPNVDIIMLEASNQFGGTWAPDRVYENLTTQQPIGLLEFSMMPMDRTGLGSQDFVPAVRLTEYLEKFVETYNLKKYIRFRAKVVRVEREGPGGIIVDAGEEPRQWKVWVEGDAKPLLCDRLIVATGLTDIPKVPTHLQGTVENFGIPVFHSKYIPQYMGQIISPETKRIVVYGGGKFAVDCIHLARLHGKKVEWVIREMKGNGDPTGGGRGPPGITAGHLGGRNLLLLVGSRFSAAPCPSIDREENWFYRFYHSGKSGIGRKLSLGYWRWFGNQIYKADLNKNENTKKLEVNIPGGLGFSVGNVALVTEPEVFKHIHDQDAVTIHRATISRISNSEVHLSNGDTLQPDLVICATGWHPVPSFFTSSQSAELGLPTPSTEYPAKLAEKWEVLESEALAKLRSQFHLLAAMPDEVGSYEMTPWRLYNHMIPTTMLKNGDNSLSFIGYYNTASTAIQSELSSLWTIAYMTGRLTIPPDEIERRTAERIANQIVRFSKEGALIPLYHLDWLAFMDHLVRELGLNPYRKGGMLSEIFSPYRPSDYYGIVDQWKAKQGL